jgi:hypothetical protein
MSVPMAIWPSMRASDEPRQKCGPLAKVRCRLSARAMSSWSGSANRSGSRLAAPSTGNTASPSRRVCPPISIVPTTIHRVIWMGLS